MPINLTNGGVVVQLNLAKALQNKGIPTRLVSPHGNEPNRIYNNFGTITDIDENTIVIYCEGVDGNPLQGRNVVRWILYGAPNKITSNFSDSDIICYFLPFCKLNVSKNRLTNVYLNENAYNKGYPRIRESCFTIKKGFYYTKNINNTRLFGQFRRKSLIRSMNLNTSLYIDNLKTQEEYIEIFNTTKFFFCYDPACFLTFIALMCGCIVIQDPMAGYSEEEWLRTCTGSTERMKGLAYGIENLHYALATIHEAPEQCRKNIETLNASIDTFIQQLKDKTYSIEKCYDFDASPYSFQHGYFKNKVMNNNVGVY